MPDDEALAGDGPEQRIALLAAELAAATCRQYRISQAEAEQRILAAFLPLPDLRQAVMTIASRTGLKRTRAYKEAAAAAKRAIYYELRRYRRPESYAAALAALEEHAASDRGERAHVLFRELAWHHVSTAERMPHIEAALAHLLSHLGKPATIIDIGCGVFPLLFPFERLPCVRRYCACDRDPDAVRPVDVFRRWRGDGVLFALQWELSSGWAPVLDALRIDRFDVALMLKLVPVVARQQPELLDTLARVPARLAIVTGSREALTKRNSIGRRELRTIDAFVDRFGFLRLSAFETPDELGYLIDLQPARRSG